MLLEALLLGTVGLFLLFCYLIAVRASNAYAEDGKTGRFIRAGNETIFFIRGFLFRPLRRFELTASNAGSTVTIYVTIFSVATLSYGWGSTIMIAIPIGLIITLWVTYRLMTRVLDRNQKGVISYVDVVERSLPAAVKYRKALVFFPIFLMFFYIVATISTEMTSLQIVLSTVTTDDEQIITGAAPSPSYQYAVFVFVACVLYILRGGFYGVVRTDVVQLGLFILLCVLIHAAMARQFGWNPFALIAHYVNLVAEQFQGGMSSVKVFIASVVLIAAWIPATLDNWIRTVGAFLEFKTLDEVTAEGRDVKREIRRSLASAGVAILFLTWTSGILGLELRSMEMCHRVNSQSVPLQNAAVWEHGCGNRNFLESAAVNEYFDYRKEIASPHLSYNEGEKGILPPDPGIDIAAFTEFTNAPYKAAMLILRDAWAALAGRDSLAFTAGMVVGVIVFASALISAAVTTMDSYAITVAQVLFRANWYARPGRIIRQFLNPVISIVLMTLLVLLLTVSGIQTPENYISFGVMAFCSLIFLLCYVLLVVVPKELDSIAFRWSLWVLFGIFGFWLTCWILHMCQFGDWGVIIYPEEDPTAWQHVLKNRTTLVLIAASMAVFPLIVYPIVKYLRGRVRGDGER